METVYQSKSFVRFAGYAGIVSAALYLVSIAGMLRYFDGDLSRPIHFATNMVNNFDMMLVYGWPGLVATVLIFPLVLAIRGHEDQQGVVRFIKIITMIGLSFVLIGYLFHLALTYFHSPMMVTTPQSEQNAVGSFVYGVVGIQDMFWLNGDLLAFLGIGLLLMLRSRGRQFPWWLSLVGIVAGLAAALGSFSFIPSLKASVLGLFFIGGFAVFAVWEILAGFYLIKSSKS